jgi:hypothetical protein
MFYIINKKINRFFGVNVAILISAVLVVLGFSYLYFVNSTVAGIVGKDSGTKEYRDLSTECQKLEKEYLALEGSVDMDYATSKGFVEKKNVDFIVREKNYAVNQGSPVNY